MWCEKCQVDVAGIASPDNERVLCTTCGVEMARSTQPADASKTLRDPRELLARWAREDALDPLDFALPGAREAHAQTNKPVLRFDGSHPVLSPQAVAAGARFASPALPVEPIVEARPGVAGKDNIIHQAHGPNPPHFQVVPVMMADKSSKWVTLVGQIFAYVGVGGLTVGTALVLMGYFGGPASYATTGWLVTTAGQMLLFLGVVTLVSGGMEQTTQEVARRIDTIGERLIRIEQAAWTGQSSKPPERAESQK
jgi:hypothetical protein